MKDRQFMVVLGLVVAAGLVMGLIAFRMSGQPAAPVAAAANGAAPADGQPHPSAADSEVASTDQPADSVPQSTESEATSGEPSAPTKEPPEMQGPANGDPPGTAAVAPSPPAATADTSSDTPQ
jgi:hypothetical protein